MMLFKKKHRARLGGMLPVILFLETSKSTRLGTTSEHRLWGIGPVNLLSDKSRRVKALQLLKPSGKEPVSCEPASWMKYTGGALLP
jgi:hypothetical protein